MIDAAGLVRALGERELADWVLVQRDQELASIEETAPGLRRAEHRTRWQLTVHHDVSAGRGSAHVELDGTVGDPDVVVDQALALARSSIGPAWRQAPPAAIARVEVEDPAIAGRDLFEAADAILHGLHRPAGATVTARASVLREHVTATARQGFHVAWGATLVHATALVAVGERSLALARYARRIADLDLDAGLAAAAADLQLLAAAGAVVPGPCAVVLATDALLHDGLGVWQAFAGQADAVVERQGLTRYREHATIAPEADRVREPLTIASDGALAFGVRSAPLGDEGEAVRKFALVERGIAAGLGLSPREGALRQRDPNGGVRNLVVTAGSWAGETAGRTIEVRRLRDLAIDPYTGDATFDLALALDAGKPFAGGTLRLDLIDVLARARRSAAKLRRGAYEGPAAVWIERAELLA